MTLDDEWCDNCRKSPQFCECPTEKSVCSNDLLSAAVDRICGPAFDLIQKDPHQWSDHGCVTCQTITALIQRPFGCVLYSKRKGK